jgi:hypothetical protein
MTRSSAPAAGWNSRTQSTNPDSDEEICKSHGFVRAERRLGLRRLDAALTNKGGVQPPQSKGFAIDNVLPVYCTEKLHGTTQVELAQDQQ